MLRRARSTHGARQLCLAVTLSLAAVSSIATHAQDHASSSGSGVISPAVVAAWSARADRSGLVVLDFLVLLRGEPGWFMRGGNTSSGSSSFSGDEPGPVILHVSRGNRDLELRFDPASLMLTIEDHVVSLQGANVVLVDGVDLPDGLRVNTVLWVDPQLSDLKPSFIHSLVQQEPAIFAFLRCDASLEDAAALRMFEALCDLMRPE